MRPLSDPSYSWLTGWRRRSASAHFRERCFLSCTLPCLSTASIPPLSLLCVFLYIQLVSQDLYPVPALSFCLFLSQSTLFASQPRTRPGTRSSLSVPFRVLLHNSPCVDARCVASKKEWLLEICRLQKYRLVFVQNFNLIKNISSQQLKLFSLLASSFKTYVPMFHDHRDTQYHPCKKTITRNALSRSRNRRAV